MPRLTINYDNTIIYKLQHIDNEELLYVGHTTDFTKRKSAHKSNTLNAKNKAHGRKVYEMIRTNGGWDMFAMLQIKTFSCLNRREAESEEDNVMREMRATMNTNRAFLSEQDKKNYNATYKNEHVLEVKAYAKNNRENKRVQMFSSENWLENYKVHLVKQRAYNDAYKARQLVKQNNLVYLFLMEIS